MLRLQRNVPKEYKKTGRVEVGIISVGEEYWRDRKTQNKKNKHNVIFFLYIWNVPCNLVLVQQSSYEMTFCIFS